MFWGIVLAVLAGAAVLWFVVDRLRHQDPEDAATHRDDHRRADTLDRPAGPAAEGMGVGDPGDVTAAGGEPDGPLAR